MLCHSQVGFDDNGKLLAIVATAYSDGGAVFHPENNEHTFDYVDSGEDYNIRGTVLLIRENTALSHGHLDLEFSFLKNA